MFGKVAWICILTAVLAGLAIAPTVALAWFSGAPHENVLVGALGPESDDFYESPGSQLAPGSMTTNGRTIVFSSMVGSQSEEDRDAGDVFVRDLVSGSLELISRRSGDNGAAGGQMSNNPRISLNGRFVAFDSKAWNLTGDEDFNQKSVFMRDRLTKVTQLISKSVDGAAIPGTLLDLSGDGQRALIHTEHSPFVTEQCTGLFIRDIGKNTTIPVGNFPGPTGASLCPTSDASLSGDGTTVAVVTKSRLTTDAPSDAWSHIYLVNIETKEFQLIDRADGNGPVADEASDGPVISGNGKVVLFRSNAKNLVPGSKSGALYVRDIEGKTTRPVSVGYRGDLFPALYSRGLSDDGSVITFGTWYDGLVPEDQNDKPDVFVREMSKPSAVLIHRMNGLDGGVSDEHLKYGSMFADVSPDGSVAAFHTTARYFTPESTNFSSKVIARTLRPWTAQVLPPVAPYVWPISEIRVPDSIRTRQLTRLRGTAKDDTRVDHVYLQVARKARGRCAWLKRSGGLARGSCSRPMRFKVRGTTKWQHVLREHLPPGTYEALSIAVDVQGNRERIRDKKPATFTVRR